MMIVPIAVLATCSSLICIVSSQENSNFLTIEKLDYSLTQAISNSHENNWFISPASIAISLGLVYFGAEGDTKKEIAGVLGLSSDTDTANNQLTELQHNLKGSESSKVTWLIANKILVNKNAVIVPQYESDVKTKFLSEIETVDFLTDDTSSSVNSWVEKKTKGFIKELLSPGDVDSKTQMILLNAVYFKGIWKSSFNKGKTKKECFYTKDNKCTKVNMMFQKSNFKMTISMELEAKMLELPYTDQDYSLVIVLPLERDGLKKVIEKMKSFNILENLKQWKQLNVNVYLPKFKYEFTLDLKDTLMKLGATSMFNDTANFTSMIDIPSKVSKVIHKARISVFETGTIAAAVTAVKVTAKRSGSRRKEIYFIANHPFLFYIKYKSTILFKGVKIK